MKLELVARPSISRTAYGGRPYARYPKRCPEPAPHVGDVSPARLPRDRPRRLPHPPSAHASPRRSHARTGGSSRADRRPPRPPVRPHRRCARHTRSRVRGTRDAPNTAEPSAARSPYSRHPSMRAAHAARFSRKVGETPTAPTAPHPGRRTLTPSIAPPGAASRRRAETAFVGNDSPPSNGRRTTPSGPVPTSSRGTSCPTWTGCPTRRSVARPVSAVATAS
jgi:hypothetical protein